MRSIVASSWTGSIWRPAGGCGPCSVPDAKPGGRVVPGMELHPFDEVVREAGERIRPGVVVHQQFACASCGSKQTMETPNVFYTGGRCEECGTEKHSGRRLQLHGHPHPATMKFARCRRCDRRGVRLQGAPSQ